MTNIKYFTNVETLEQLKKEYRQLAKKYHPDISKIDNATLHMQAINKEYDILFDQLKQIGTTIKNETSATFKNIINDLIKYDNITIDIVGSWLWVYGKGTFKIKDQLKKHGFVWRRKRKKWSLGELTKKSYKNNLTYNDIINKYGLERMTTKNNNKPLLTD